MSFECKYCNKKLSSQSSLNVHLKRAKYCINKRPGKNRSGKNTNFECDRCHKKYTSKQNLNIHMENCLTKENYIKEINILNKKLEEKDIQLIEQKEQYETKIQHLQDKLENIAIKAVSRPVSTTKNTQINYIQQLQPVTEEHLVSNVSHLTIDHIIKGPEGYAEYALNYPLKDRMICSDYSRRKVKFKDKDGNLITDPEMTTLTKKFFESIHEKNKELICKYANELKDRLGDENVMDTVVKIFEYKEAVNRARGGEKTDFHYDFVKSMCSQTIA